MYPTLKGQREIRFSVAPPLELVGCGVTRSGAVQAPTIAPPHKPEQISGVLASGGPPCSNSFMSGGTERVERKLAAIFCADVADYSRLMHADEEKTLRALSAHRTIMDSFIAEHGGRIANTAGDSVLAEFPSVVNAVECAAAVQEKLRAAEEGTAESATLRFRIGVHVGDVMVRGGDLLGDGVNIAARIQALAEPGGVWITGRAYEEIEGKTGRSFEDRGEHQVKNIARPLRVYELVDGGDRSESLRLPLPDKPSIAVLPFTNMSGDPEQEYFCDGLVEDIITALSRVRSFFVIARNSSFCYKGRSVQVTHVGRELGVRYVLEGSVRKAADRLRITGQLVEAETGHHVWADRFEGRIEDIFDLQDRITASVVAAIEPNVLLAELQRSRSKPTQNLTAYDLYLRSLPLTHQNSQDTLSEATDLLRRALALDSSYSDAWAGLADCVARQTFNGFIESWESGGQAACEAALKAVEADPENGRAVSVRAWNLSAFAGKNDEASELAARALRLHPNSAYVQTNCGWTFAYDGDTERALACFDAARRMSPLDPRGYLTFNGLAMAHLLSGNFAEVDRWTARALDQRRAVPATLRIRAAALAHLGRDDDARNLVRELLAIQPNATIDRAARLGVRDERQRAIFLEGLRLAGLPE